MKTDESIALEIRRKVKAICRALSTGPHPSPEELAGRAHACLLTAASMRLIAGGYSDKSGLDEDLLRRMVDAAMEAMEDTLQAVLAESN